jgi:hypothetical protein
MDRGVVGGRPVALVEHHGGAIVTLDELCVQDGVPPLPLLEGVPDELEMPLDEVPP